MGEDNNKQQGIDNKDFESIAGAQDLFLKNAEETFAFTRAATSEVGALNFHLSPNSNSHYVTPNHKLGIGLVTKDQRSHWLDIKHIDIQKANNEVSKTISGFPEAEKYHATHHSIKRKVFELLIKERKKSEKKKERYPRKSIRFKEIHSKEEQDILTGLYNSMGSSRNNYWDIINERLVLNKDGKELLFHVFSGIYYDMKSINTDTKKNTFDDNIHYAIDNLISSDQFDDEFMDNIFVMGLP